MVRPELRRGQFSRGVFRRQRRQQALAGNGFDQDGVEPRRHDFFNGVIECMRCVGDDPQMLEIRGRLDGRADFDTRYFRHADVEQL